jgi:hypothetical protein
MVATSEVYLNNTPSQDDQDDLQKMRDYLASIYAQFAMAYDLINLIDQDSPDIAKDAAELANIQASLQALHDKWHLNISTNLADYKNASDLCTKVKAAIDAVYKPWNVPYGIAVLYNNLQIGGTPLDTALQDLYVKQGQVTDLEAQLLAIDKDLAPLLDEINTLMYTLAHNNVSSQFVNNDLAELMKFMKPLFTALKERLQIDEDKALIAAGDKAGLNDSDIEKLFLDMMRVGMQEQSNLSDLEDQMAKSVQNERNVENHDTEQLKKFNWWTHLRTLGGDEGKEARLQAERKNARMMENVVRDLMKGLSSEMASSSPGLSEISMMFDFIMKEVKKIESSDLSPREKRDQVMGLLGMVLSLLSAIQSQVAADRAALDKKVAGAMQNASLMSISDSISQQKQLANLKHAASVMKKVLFAAKIIMVVVASFFSAGLASRAVMAGLGGLDLSGGPNGQSVTDKLTNKLALAIDELLQGGYEPGHRNSYFYNKQQPSEKARIIAEVIMGVSEAALFIAAAGGDNLLADGASAAESTANAAVQQTEATMERLVTNTLNQLAAEEGKVVTQDMIDTTMNQLKNLMKESVELTQKKTAQMLMQDYSPTGVIGLAKLFKGTYEPAMRTAEAAVQETLQQAENFARMGFQGAFSDEALETTANKIANRVLAKEMDTTEVLIAKATDQAKTLTVKAIALTYYSLANSNFLVDSIVELMKKEGMKEDEQAFLVIQNIARVFQMIVAMGSMIGMSSITPQLITQAIPVWASSIMGASQAASLTLTATAELSLATNAEHRAKILPQVAQDKAEIEAFQLLLKQLFQSQKSDQDQYSDLAVQTYKSGEQIVKDGLFNNDDIARILATTV